MTIEPKHCKTMNEVRAGVDSIDQSLVQMLVVRQEYMAAAARIKQDRDAVHDTSRIEDVMEKVLIQAKTNGLSTTIAEPVWRKLIQCCIQYEFERWDAIQEVEDES